MKKNILLLTVSFSLTVMHDRISAQMPGWLWAKSAVGSETEIGRSIATDAAGNVMTIGEFGPPSMTFGATVLTNAGPINTNSRDIFIVKYDSAGNMLWVKSAGGDGDEYASSICTDANGNILVTGNFGSDSITFGTSTLFNDTISSMFAVKYDPSGNVLWAKTAKATWTNAGTGIATDAAGNVLLTGVFYGPWIAFGLDTLTNAGGQDFLVKYDSSGKLLWVKSEGGNSYHSPKSIVVDSEGNILVTGSGVDFSGNGGVFIAKHDSSGNVLWTKSAGGADEDCGTSIFTDSANNVLVTGYFESYSITFDTTTLANYAYSAAFLPTDLFLVKYDPGGNLLWAKKAGGYDDEEGWGITCDLSGNIFMTGSFESDSVSFGAYTLQNSGPDDIFVVRYTASGNEDWATSVKGTYSDVGFAIATDFAGNVLLTGLFGSSLINFGTIALINTGYLDFFVAKLDRNGVSGINEFSSTDFEIRITPNPFPIQTTFQISRPLINSSGIVYNSVGQAVKYLDNISDQTIFFHRGNLPGGLYFMRLTQDGGTISTGKFVIVDQ